MPWRLAQEVPLTSLSLCFDSWRQLIASSFQPPMNHHLGSFAERFVRLIFSLAPLVRCLFHLHSLERFVDIFVFTS